MAGNTSPIYSSKGDIQFGILQVGNPTFDCTTGTSASVCTAGSDGNFIQKLRFKASGSLTTSASAARIFIRDSSGGGNTITNTTFYDEVTLPAVNVAPSASSANTTIEVPMNFVLPANYKILAVLSANQPTGVGWYVTAIGGSYAQPS